MNKLKYVLCVLLVATLIFSCSKDETLIKDQPNELFNLEHQSTSFSHSFTVGFEEMSTNNFPCLGSTLIDEESQRYQMSVSNVDPLVLDAWEMAYGCPVWSYYIQGESDTEFKASIFPLVKGNQTHSLMVILDGGVDHLDYFLYRKSDIELQLLESNLSEQNEGKLNFYLHLIEMFDYGLFCDEILECKTSNKIEKRSTTLTFYGWKCKDHYNYCGEPGEVGVVVTIEGDCVTAGGGLDGGGDIGNPPPGWNGGWDDGNDFVGGGSNEFDNDEGNFDIYDIQEFAILIAQCEFDLPVGTSMDIVNPNCMEADDFCDCAKENVEDYECINAINILDDTYDLNLSELEKSQFLDLISPCDTESATGSLSAQLLNQISANNPYFEPGIDIENYLNQQANLPLLVELWQYSNKEEGKDVAAASSMSIYSNLSMLNLLDLSDAEAYGGFFDNFLFEAIERFLSDPQKALSNSAWYRIFKNNIDEDGNWIKAINEAITVGWAEVIQPFSEEVAEKLQELGADNLPETAEQLQALTMIYAPMLAELGIDVATDLIPVVGEVKGIYRTVDAMIDGNYGTAAFEFVGTIAGLIPIGDMVKGGINVIKFAGVAFTAFKVIKALGKVSGTIYTKIIELTKAGWEVIWDNGLKKFVFKNDKGAVVGSIDNNGTPNIANNLFKWSVDLQNLKTLNAKTLNPESANYLSKTFINENGARFNLHNHPLKSKFDDIVELGDNSNPPGAGKRTEELMELLFDGEQGYTFLDGSYNSGINGFDGVLQNGDEIIILESKQWTGSNSVKLTGPSTSPTSDLPAQMTDDWVEYVVDKLNEQGKEELANKIKDAKDLELLTKVVTVVDRTTSGNADGILGGIALIKVN